MLSSKFSTLVLVLLSCISIVYANTEVISVKTGKDFLPAPFIEIDNSQDPIRLSNLKKVYTASPQIKRKLIVDLLKFTKKMSPVVKNSRNLSPITFKVELVNVEPDTSYNIKVCWSALNPVDVELHQVEVPPTDTDPHSHLFLNIKLRPNYYASTSVKIEDYLNDIIIDVECINGDLIRKLVGWVVTCLIIGVGVAKFLLRYIEKGFS